MAASVPPDGALTEQIGAVVDAALRRRRGAPRQPDLARTAALVLSAIGSPDAVGRLTALAARTAHRRTRTLLATLLRSHRP